MLLSAAISFGQSHLFNSGKYLEIQSLILRTLEDQYVDTIRADELLKTGIEAMLATLDPYTVMIGEENEENLEIMTTGSYGGVGALIQKMPSQGILIAEPYENSAAVKFGLEPGDTIIAIDGNSILALDATECSNRMRGRPGSVVKLEVIKGRGGDTVTIDLVRERIHVNDVGYYGMTDDSTGYINIGGFTMDGSKDVKKALLDLKERGASRMVLDLRNNGGGLMSEAIGIVSLFVPSGTMVVYAKGKNAGSYQEFRTKTKPVDTVMPLLVMVNSGSASSSEIVAGALQDMDRAAIAGVKTYGKGLVQSIRAVGYNTNLKLTTAKYYIPSGRCVQAIDYSNRNEDGSVGMIPDSLKRQFKTKGGRTVYDGGGIDPDIIIEPLHYSRPIIALIYNNIVNDYAINYYKNHRNIKSVGDIVISDEQYDDFVKFAASRDFDNRTESQIKMESVVKLAEAEQLIENIDGIKELMDSLMSRISLSKEEFLIANKDLIKPLIENEIAIKYFFRRSGLEISLRDDMQIKKALNLWKSWRPVSECVYARPEKKENGENEKNGDFSEE